MFVETAPPTWLADLNPAQSAAVGHDGGPMLVVAGAGTGKTKTLAARVARLIAEGGDPERILLLTFSRRASREMLHRAEHMGADRRVGRVWGGTFHAVGSRILREHGRAVGLSPSFTILDQGDATDLMGVMRGELGFGERGKRFPKKDTLLDIYSRVANAQEKLADVLEQRFPWCRADLDDLRSVFGAYAERKRSRGVLDYDDLLLYWRALVTDSSAVHHLQHQFDHVLVDEYQDTNLLQADIVAGLRPEGDGLFVVGDDAQAIYGFRAASAANMAGFSDRFPGAAVVTLDHNYRSNQPILDVANALMANARGVFPKALRAARIRVDARRPVLARAEDEGTEAVYVCERVLEHREQGVALREQAVLFRTSHHSARLEVELGRRNIPFVKYGGLKFLEAAHVKDLLAFLRILENPSDELAWHRLLGLLDGVGPATAARIVESLELPNPTALRGLIDAPPEVPSRAQPDLDRLRLALGACLDLGATPTPAVEIDVLRTHTVSLFEHKYPDAAVRMVDLEQLQGMASAVATRAQLLSEITIDPPASTSDLAGPPLLDDDFLILSTIHSAKGLEFAVVHLIHAADGNIPSDMSLTDAAGLEEERRVLYVGLTRARDHLYVTYPTRFYHRRHSLDDAHSYAQPSRFLQGMGGLFDEPETAAAEVLRGTPVEEGPDKVSSNLAALWA